MKEQERQKEVASFPSKTGRESIYYCRSLPSEGEEIDYHFLFLHDIFDYHSRYTFLQDHFLSLFEENLAFSWIDFKGHGLSSGTRGHVDNFDEYIDDLEAYLALVDNDSRLGEVPLIIVAQGLGALVTIRHHQLNREREAHYLSGTVLINPLIKLKFQFPDWLSSVLTRLDYPLSHLKWPQQFSGKDFLCHQRDIERYDSDPLVLDYLTLGAMKEIQRVALEVSDAAYFFDFPSLFLLSERVELENPPWRDCWPDSMIQIREKSKFLAEILRIFLLNFYEGKLLSSLRMSIYFLLP